jgi:hypothetical protein
MISMGRALVVVSSAVAMLFVVLFGYWSWYHVDESITKGERWGVRIGESVDETIVRIKNDRRAREGEVVAYGEATTGGRPLGPVQGVSAHDLRGIQRIVVVWTDGEGVADLSLEFAGGRLTSAHMKNRAFELP